MKRWALMLALVLAAGCSAGSDTEAELRAEIAELRADRNLSGVSRFVRSEGARRWGVSTTSAVAVGLGGVR